MLPTVIIAINMTVPFKKDIAFNFNIIYFTSRGLKFAIPNGMQNHDSKQYEKKFSFSKKY